MRFSPSASRGSIRWVLKSRGQAPPLRGGVTAGRIARVWQKVSCASHIFLLDKRPDISYNINISMGIIERTWCWQLKGGRQIGTKEIGKRAYKNKANKLFRINN